jgi:hypothetical protein
MNHGIPKFNIRRKALNAWNQRCRADPTLPRAIPKVVMVTTHNGYLVAVLTLENGEVFRYAAIPAYRLIALPPSRRTAPAPVAPTPLTRFRRAADLVMAEMSLVERTLVNGHGTHPTD